MEDERRRVFSRDPEYSLMIQLSGLLFWFDESLQQSLRKAGFEPVTRTQSLFLLCLGAGENRPSRIASRLGLSRQAVSHIITDLSQRGLITLKVDPTDARGRIVGYSYDAQDLRRAAHAIVAELESVLQRRIGAKALRDLRSGLATDWGEVVTVEVAPKAPAGDEPKAASQR